MRLRIWRQDVSLASAVRAAAQHHSTRSRLFLEIEDAGFSGFGEVAPQPYGLNGDPGLEAVIDEFRAWVNVQVREAVEREGTLPSWSRVARWAGPRPASNPAVALLEMALLDHELRATGKAIEELWTPIAVTPIQTTGSLVGDAVVSYPPGISRLRLKVTPGPIAPASLERLRDIDVPILLDFNCSAGDASDVLDIVRAVEGYCNLVGVEQPFAPGNVVDHAKLAERLDVAVSLDEGVRSPRDIDQIVRYGAAQMVCIKPARVGGLANARTLIARAQAHGLRVYIGGFFESPFARRVHRALADQALVEPSDVGDVAVASLGYDGEVEVSEGAFGVRPSPGLLASATPVALSL